MWNANFWGKSLMPMLEKSFEKCFYLRSSVRAMRRFKVKQRSPLKLQSRERVHKKFNKFEYKLSQGCRAG
jgi:hypothetical protein